MSGRRYVRAMPRVRHAHFGRQLAAMDDQLSDIIAEIATTYGVTAGGLDRAVRMRRSLLALRLWLDGQLEREYGDFSGIGAYYFPREVPGDR